MKKYTNYIIAGAIGVVLIIVWGVVSAAPAATPPTGDTTPTFSGLKVTGDTGLYVKKTAQANDVNVNNGLTVLGPATLAGDIYASGSIQNTSDNNNGDIKINDDLEITGFAKIQKALEVADISASGDIDMGGDLQASKTIDAGGELRARSGIINPAETKYGSVSVGLPVEITDPQGLKMTKGPLNIKYDELNASGKPQNALVIDGLVSIKGGIFTNRCDGSGFMDDPTKPSYCMTVGYGDGTPGEIGVLWPITTDVDFRKDIKIKGDINAASMQVSGKASFLGDTEIKNAYITGSLQNSAGADDYIKIDDMLDVRKGIFNNDGTNLVKFGSGSKPTQLSVTGASTLSGNVDMKGEISNSTPKIGTVSGLTKPVKINDDLNVTGALTVDNISTFNKDVTINGNFKATEIGKYSISSKSISVSSQQSSTKSVDCASGEKMMSCDFFPTTKITDYFKNIYINKSVPTKSSTGWKCDATITNKNASGVPSQEISAYAICFSSSTN